jgi:hypothetical protein
MATIDHSIDPVPGVKLRGQNIADGCGYYRSAQRWPWGKRQGRGDNATRQVRGGHGHGGHTPLIRGRIGAVQKGIVWRYVGHWHKGITGPDNSEKQAIGQGVVPQ